MYIMLTQEGDILSRIPLELMITSDPSSHQGLNKLAANDPLLASVPSLALILRLLFEFNDASSGYKPYVAILPRKFSIPLFYTPEELACLKGTSILGTLSLPGPALKDYFVAVQAYIHISRIIASSDILPPGSFTVEAFMWARAVCLTRQNQINVEGGKMQLSLIPLYDMFNHRHGEVPVSKCSLILHLIPKLAMPRRFPAEKLKLAMKYA
jgi:hypothetical protein